MKQNAVVEIERYASIESEQLSSTWQWCENVHLELFQLVLLDEKGVRE